jgi:hypothetical protein
MSKSIYIDVAPVVLNELLHNASRIVCQIDTDWSSDSLVSSKQRDKCLFDLAKVATQKFNRSVS